MPVIKIDMYPGRTVEQKRELVKVFTEEFARIAKGNPKDVVIVIQDDASKENWGHGGTLASDE